MPYADTLKQFINLLALQFRNWRFVIWLALTVLILSLCLGPVFITRVAVMSMNPNEMSFPMVTNPIEQRVNSLKEWIPVSSMLMFALVRLLLTGYQKNVFRTYLSSGWSRGHLAWFGIFLITAFSLTGALMFIPAIGLNALRNAADGEMLPVSTLLGILSFHFFDMLFYFLMVAAVVGMLRNAFAYLVLLLWVPFEFILPQLLAYIFKSDKFVNAVHYMPRNSTNWVISNITRLETEPFRAVAFLGWTAVFIFLHLVVMKKKDM
ncbi:MAG: hypothetical protein V4543_14600 [Bacteroidota bacterium]